MAGANISGRTQEERVVGLIQAHDSQIGLIECLVYIFNLEEQRILSVRDRVQ